MIMMKYSCRFCFFLLIVIVLYNVGKLSESVKVTRPSNKFLKLFYEDKNQKIQTEQAFPYSRKLLVHDGCTSRDISISQSRDSTSGIPQFIVQIVNTCVSGCAPSEIHVHCGWFASARIVNPKTFKRLSYDDCSVNGGKPLKTGQIIRFTYSNSFMYPISFKSAKFC